MAAEGNEDAEEYDLYHVDFTTASEWEVFIARIEEVLQQWKLHQNRFCNPKEKLCNVSWNTLTENICFADYEFVITRYFVKNLEEENITEEEKKNQVPATLITLMDIMNIENDFIPIVYDGDESSPHVLVRWYGLRDFVVLTPLKGHLTSESKLKLLLSSFSMAANNISCQVPLFVRFLEPWQKFYVGIYEGQEVRTDFEMVHLKKIPSQCRHLTGLLSLFKSKIGESDFTEPIMVAARFAYCLHDWTNFAWTQDPPDIELFSGDIGWSELGSFPFGSVCEPINSITLYTCWPEVLETMAVDNELYSDFDPLSAPVWSLSITKTDNPVCLLTDYVTEFLLYCTSNKTIEDLLGDFVAKEASDVLQPFSLLTESRIPTITTLLSQYASKKKSVEGPINQKLLMPILFFLFPDVEENSKFPYSEEKEVDKSSSQRMKTCGRDSLIWRLALVMAHSLHMFGGAKAAAHIWHEFSQEIRFRWNSNNMIPGVAPGFPDPKSCLLHQKLQMINCCIERRKKSEEAAVGKRESDESDDEFFDCDENVEDEAKPASTTPVGRLSQHNSLKLINTGQPLYIPVTQGATPKTEDQLEEDAQVLIQLGSDAEGSQLRAKIMSASLLSDMESFKAANPGACIEDFIRWYSPRDWVEEEGEDQFGQKKGKLSARMTLPGNTWLEVWDSAKPVPANRQKRLFDETREAEKALHFLESQTPASSGLMVVPVLAHAAVEKLNEEAKDIQIPSLQNTVQQAVKRVEALSRNAPMDVHRYQELCFELGYAETVVSQIKSIESKLGTDEVAKEFACKIVSEGETVLPGGSTGSIASKLKTIFVDARKACLIGDLDGGGSSAGENPNNSVLPQATEKEFILRATAPRPHRHSRPTPQRLHVRVSKTDISMAGAFTQDKTFF